MRFVVVGSGPIGLAACIALCTAKDSVEGMEVLLVCRKKELADRINAHGAQLQGSGHPCKPLVVPSIQAAGEYLTVTVKKKAIEGADPDVVWIVCTKTSANAAICDELKAVDPDLVSNVVVSQNGFEPEVAFENALRLPHGPIRVVVNVAARIVEGESGDPNSMDVNGPVIVHSFKSGTSYRVDNYIGCTRGDGPALEIAKRVGDVLTAGNYPHTFDSDLRHRVWKKAVLNCSVNAPCSLLQARIGEVFEGAARQLVLGVVDECIAVGEKHGIDFGGRDTYVERAIEFLGTVLPHFPSMVHDVRAKQQTEIESLNGYVVELGRQYGIPVPMCGALLLMVRNLDELLRQKQKREQ